MEGGAGVWFEVGFQRGTDSRGKAEGAGGGSLLGWGSNYTCLLPAVAGGKGLACVCLGVRGGGEALEQWQGERLKQQLHPRGGGRGGLLIRVRGYNYILGRSKGRGVPCYGRLEYIIPVDARGRGAVLEDGGWRVCGGRRRRGVPFGY